MRTSDKELESTELEKRLSSNSNLKEIVKALHAENDIHLRNIRTAPIDLDRYLRYCHVSEDISALQLHDEYIEYIKKLKKNQIRHDDE